MTITVDVEGIEDIQDLLNRIPGTMYSNAKQILSTSLFNIQRTVTQRLQNGPMFSRTGQLARSIKFKTGGDNIANMSGVVYTDSKYAPTHEYGATIRAKNAYARLPGGPYLNIPSSQNRTGAGVMRENARSVFNSGGYIIPLNAPRARYAVMKNGIPMFWLVKQVTIPARLGMRETADNEVPTYLSNLQSGILDGLDD